MQHDPLAPVPADTHPPADMERRFAAFLIDRVVTWGLAAAVAFGAAMVVDERSGLIAVLVFVVVDVLAGLVIAVLIGTTGLTPGKAATGIRVLSGTTGRPIGIGAALLRTAVLGLAGLPTAGMGIATLAWTAAMDPTGQRRGLHDRFGSAVVVDVRPIEVAAEQVEERPQQIVNLTAMRLMPTPVVEQPAPMPAAPVAMPARTPASAAAAPPSPSAAPISPVPPVPAPPPAQPPAPPRVSLGTEQTLLRTQQTSPPTPAPGAHAAPRWRVEFDTGETFVVEGLALVGRSPQARPGEDARHVVPLRSSDMSVSKTHAQFSVAADGALVVMDRGSTNGSSITRRGMSRPLSPGRPATLLPGDVVHFGDRAMTVRRDQA